MRKYFKYCRFVSQVRRYRAVSSVKKWKTDMGGCFEQTNDFDQG